MIQWDGGQLVDKFKLSDCVGRRLICDDGIPRLVVNIVFSNRYKDKAIINETDPDLQAGVFIHLLSLSCQMLGKPLPDREAREAFSRYVKALWYEEDTSKKKEWLKAMQNLKPSR